MSTSMPPVVGVFTDPALADRAIGALSNVGFSSESISYSGLNYGGFLANLKSLFTGEDEKTTHVLHDLLRMGVPEEQARYYANEYHAGHPVIAVRAAGHEQEARQILRSTGGYDYSSHAGPAGGTFTGTPAQDREGMRGADVDVGGNVTARDRTAYANQTGAGYPSQPGRSPQPGYAGPPVNQPPVSPPVNQPSAEYMEPTANQPQPRTGYAGPETGQSQPRAGYAEPPVNQPQAGYMPNQPPTGYTGPASNQPPAGPVNQSPAGYTGSQRPPGSPIPKRPRPAYPDRTDVNAPPDIDQTAYPDQSTGPNVDTDTDRSRRREDPSP